LEKEKQVTMKEHTPSHFAALGQPLCSIWGECEMEVLAEVFVKALARSGDTWRLLSLEKAVKLVPEERLHPESERDQKRWKQVTDAITDSESARSISLWWRVNN
jgi:hypothetical protein